MSQFYFVAFDYSYCDNGFAVVPVNIITMESQFEGFAD